MVPLSGMKRRLPVFLLGLVIASFCACTIQAASPSRPNVVWLVSEDNSKHFLKLFDKHGAETPRIEALARNGLAFDHAFSQAPVCSVARTTLATGCYAPRIGTQYHRRAKLVPMPEGVRMFPAYLREAGYYTANNNKKDYNAIEGPGVWDVSSAKATWRDRQAGQPFFYMQSFPVTHEGRLHFPESDVENVPTKTDPNAVFVPPIHPDTPLFRYTYARYHDLIHQMDAQIGAVVDQLAADGLLEDTFIFYFGDHGGVVAGSKGYVYETGLHVPLVVRVPEKWKHLVDAERGSRVNGFVSFIDFGPTVLNLAGVDVPRGMDGRPFLGKGVKMAEVNRRDEVFCYADRFDEKYDQVRALRKGHFKYMRSYQPFNFDGLQNNYRYLMAAYREWRELYRAGKLNPVQAAFFEPRAPEALYDIDNDPYETRNLAANPDYADTLRDMRKGLTRWVERMPDLSFYPESYLVDHAFDNPVEFGQDHKREIRHLVEIADLSLVPFGKAESKIARALASKNPWERYWGLITCSSHGKAARPLVETARKLAQGDPERLVRVRAAEFLGLIGAADPRPIIMAALAETKSEVEANLILNTVVLLRDGQPGYEFKVTPEDVSHDFPMDQRANVRRRLEYLAK